MDPVESADGQFSPADTSETAVPADVQDAFIWLGLYGVGVSVPMAMPAMFTSLQAMFIIAAHFVLGVACWWISGGLRRGQRWAIYSGVAVTLFIAGAMALILFAGVRELFEGVPAGHPPPHAILLFSAALGLLCAVVCYRLIRLSCTQT